MNEIYESVSIFKLSKLNYIFNYILIRNHHFHHLDSIDPFPDLLHYRLFPCHGGHFGGHNCIGAYG